jgi:hypothetical protein
MSFPRPWSPHPRNCVVHSAGVITTFTAIAVICVCAHWFRGPQKSGLLELGLYYELQLPSLLVDQVPLQQISAMVANGTPARYELLKYHNATQNPTPWLQLIDTWASKVGAQLSWPDEEEHPAPTTGRWRMRLQSLLFILYILYYAYV